MGLNSRSGEDVALKLPIHQLTDTQRLVIVACFKTTLTLEEAAAYAGLSVSHIYKLTSSGKIPHFKPSGKVIYFDRAELDAWMKRNRVKTTEEIEHEAATYIAVGNVKQEHSKK
ncbi:helix-turn-helix domain-containing protein [Spirosoma gilvum]